MSTDDTNATRRGSGSNDLLGRLEAHACMHDDLAMYDQEQRQWAADLRAAKFEIERLRGVVPEVLERLNDDLCAENERVRAALLMAEAALSDIGDADRDPGDDLAWCETRAAQDLPAVRAALVGLRPNGPGEPMTTARTT